MDYTDTQPRATPSAPMTRREWEWRSAAGMVRRFTRRPETDPVKLKWLAIERELRSNRTTA